MKEADPEHTITLPMNEFICLVETFLTSNHPVYQFVWKHYNDQIFKRLGLE